MARQVLDGAVEDVANLINSMVDFLEKAILSPGETAKEFIHVTGAIYDYGKMFVARKVNLITDVTAFCHAYIENVYMQEAAEFGLNYEEFIAPEAKASIAGKNVSEALTRAMKMAGADKRRPDLFLDPQIDHDQILINYQRAKDLKVFEDKNNLQLLRNRNAPWGRDISWKFGFFIKRRVA